MKYVYVLLAILICIGVYFLGDYIGDYVINKSLFVKKNMLNDSQLKIVSEKVAKKTKTLVDGFELMQRRNKELSTTKFQKIVFTMLKKVDENSINYVNGSFKTPEVFNNTFTFYPEGQYGNLFNGMLMTSAFDIYAGHKEMNLKQNKGTYYFFMAYFIEVIGVVLVLILAYKNKSKFRL